MKKTLAAILALCLMVGCVLAGCSGDNATTGNSTTTGTTTGGNTTAGGNTTGNNETKPDATDPDATNPDATNPDATDPDATEPDATDPDATDPDVKNPALEQAQQSPLLYLIAALDRTDYETKLPNAEALEKLMTALCGKGTILVNVDELDGAYIGVEISYDLTAGTALISMPTAIGNGTVESYLRIYITTEGACISCPDLLDDVYGISFENFWEDLENCEIWEVLGYSFEDLKAMIGETLDQIFAAFEQGDTDWSQQLQSTMEKLNMLANEIVFVAEDVDGTAVSVSCTMTAEQVNKLLDGLFDEVSTYLTLLGNAYPDLIPSDVTTQIEQLAAMFKMYAFDVDFRAVIDNESGMVTEESYTVTMKVEESTMVIEGRCDMSDLRDITVEVITKLDGEVVSTTLTRMVCNDTDSVLDRSYTMSVDGVETMSYSLRYDGTDFTVTTVSEGETISMGFKFIVTETELSISDAYVVVGGEKITFDFELTVRAECDAITMPAYKNVLELPAETWQAILEYLGVIEPEIPEVA